MKQKRTKIAMLLALTLVLTLISSMSYKMVEAAKKVSTPKITVSALSDGAGITVTIKKTKNAEGYTIYLKGPQDKEYIAVTTLEKNGKAKRKCDIKDLSGGEYNVKVKAYLKSGSKTVWSKESKVFIITIKGKSSKERSALPADVEEYVNKNYPSLLSLYNQGLIDFKAEYETKEYITFGSFDMEYFDEDYNYGSDGEKENMVWEVLEYSPDKKTALVLSKNIIKGIEHDPSNPESEKTITWKDSSIRKWLNGDFYKNAFSKEEKALVNKVTVDNSSVSDGGKDTEDNIFLLSPTELVKYYPDEDEGGSLINRYGYYYNGERGEAWALRTPAPGNANNVSYVYYDGGISSYSSGAFYILGIRPACRITLTDDIINKNNLSVGKNYKKILKDVYVTLGSYEEDGKKDALEWMVLEYNEDNGKALMISKNILGEYRFNEEKVGAEWASSTLRAFLNGEFFRGTFTDEEKPLLIQTSLENPGADKTADTVFALSVSEFEKYDKVKNVVSCYKNGALGYWWLREVDEYGYCRAVESGCDVCDPYPTEEFVGIRPVINIDLKYDKNAPISRLNTPSYNVKALKQDKKIVITINKNLNSDGYLIYLKKASDKDFSEIADVKQGKSGSVEYTLSELEAGKYSFRVIAYKKNGSDTLKSEYEETEIRLEEPDGILTHKAEREAVDAADYVKENYPGLYDLYQDGKIGLAGEGKRDTIVLGSYELEYALKGKKSYPKTEKMPLEWEVLEYSADGTKALVISKYIICHRVFDDYSLVWENSSLRKWLNSDFYKKAFTEEEQAVIRLSDVRHEDLFLDGNDTSDRIFLLSVNDANKYFANNYDRIGYFIDKVAGSWWLREDNRSANEYSSWDSYDWDEEYWPNAHPTVNDTGVIDSDDCDVAFSFIGVRPSFWINLTDEIIKENNLSILKGTEPEIEKAYVVFGSTESEDKPLEWEILDYDEKNKKVLLISRYIVDTLKYNSSTKKNAWASSTLRSYLNGDFIAKSFSKSEQALISSVKLENKTRQGTKEKATEDKIYILSYAELLKYFPVPYFNEKKTDSDICYYSWVSLDMKNKCGSIWLRTYDEEEETIMLVNSCGAIDEEGDEADTSKGVRPVLWLNLY